jgi:hypothetical protein
MRTQQLSLNGFPPRRIHACSGAEFYSFVTSLNERSRAYRLGFGKKGSKFPNRNLNVY